MEQAACANAIDALFVLLNLLEGQAQGIREFLLAHTQHDPPGPNPGADMLIDLVGRLLLQTPLLPLAHNVLLCHFQNFW